MIHLGDLPRVLLLPAAYLSPHAIMAIHDTGRHVIRWPFVVNQGHNDGKCMDMPSTQPGSCQDGAVEPYDATKNCKAPYPASEGECECRCKTLSDAYGYCCSTVHSYGGERAFLRTMHQEFPEWRPIHFHSSWMYRHGVTVMQKDRITGLANASGIL